MSSNTCAILSSCFEKLQGQSQVDPFEFRYLIKLRIIIAIYGEYKK
jgi:hypothetical protein